ncbi:MAG: mechanosensitive ion channel family protein [Myxococcota bacterium]|nr:mechanosensitive ion channel family protein [Myxococcota bacterium]
MSVDALWGLLKAVSAQPWLKAAVVILVGLVAVQGVARFLHRRLLTGANRHWAMVGRRIVTVLGTLAVLLAGAKTMGLDLTALLATAGVATVAIGFAAQTSLSNLIAGLFLLIDRPFQVGDTVELEGRVGQVQEISLMSTLVRTFDNLLVRWPNEVVLKATILNYSRYPARRVDIPVSMPHGADLARAREVLLTAVSEVDTVLLEPAPQVVTKAMLDSAVQLEVRVWVPQPEFLAGRTQAIEAVHNGLKAAGIRVAFPQLTVWKGEPD